MSVKSISLGGKGAARLRKGHPWIYRSDVVSVGADVTGGDLVCVRLPDGKFAGYATWSDHGQLSGRMTPIGPDVTDPEASFLHMVTQAVARRKNRPAACRLINGDADGLPGLIVDRYGPGLSIQALTQAAARRQDAIVERLLACTGARVVVARNDVKVRAFEGLPMERGVLVSDPGVDPADIVVEMHGLRLRYDLLDGQKTGGFLDQTDNRVAAAAVAHGDALDCFCYDGGFSLHLAAAGCNVTSVDSSGPALARLTRRAADNGLEKKITPVEENVFDLLRTYERDGRRFDTIVLDPPAFAKSRDSVDAGRRAYKEINLRGLKLLRHGGTLITCSCSAHMDRAGFEHMLAEAAGDARRFVRILDRRSAAPDHPTLVTAPETDYLKVLIAEAH